MGVGAKCLQRSKNNIDFMGAGSRMFAWEQEAECLQRSRNHIDYMGAGRCLHGRRSKMFANKQDQY
jgi:hypothetical protein